MVDQRERSNDQEESMRIAQDRHAQTLWTALPVIVKEDSKGHTVDLRPAIKGWQRNRSGAVEPVEISWLGSCPVHFVSGGDFVITHPVKKDDEAIVLFSTRCIDGWWKEGGVQAEPYRRSHHLSDGMYIGGVRSNPRALGGNPDQQQNGQQRQSNNTRAASTSTIQIRTERGDHFIELSGAEQEGRSPIDIIIPEPFADGQEAIEGRPGPCVNISCVRCNIKASEKVHIDSPVTEIAGDLKVKGEVTAKADVQASQDFGRIMNRDAARIADLTPAPRAGEEVSLSTHRHRDTQGGTGQSGPPAAGT